MRNYSYENEFDLHENETACRTHFHMKGLALKLVLKQRHKRTREWPIGNDGREKFSLKGAKLWRSSRNVFRATNWRMI